MGVCEHKKEKKERKSSGFFFYYRRTPDRPYKAKHTFNIHTQVVLSEDVGKCWIFSVSSSFCWLVWRHLIHAKTKKQKATFWICTLIRTQSIEMCVCWRDARGRVVEFLYNNISRVCVCVIFRGQLPQLIFFFFFVFYKPRIVATPL